jgi:hypothetical protein
VPGISADVAGLNQRLVSPNGPAVIRHRSVPELAPSGVVCLPAAGEIAVSRQPVGAAVGSPRLS